MKINGTYIWSAAVQVEVPDDATDEAQREALDEALKKLNVKKVSELDGPTLHESSNEDLID